MEGDPQCAELLKKHKGDGADQEIEILQEDQAQEVLGHLRKAIYWLEARGESGDTAKQRQLDKMMMSMLVDNTQVAEIYSPPRVAKIAKSMGLRAGWSLDLTTQDEDGRNWDFTGSVKRNRAAREVLQHKPLLLVGSPVCIVHSVVNHANHARMPEEVVKQRSKEARLHIEFWLKLYNLQREDGRCFLHEHPESASPWQEECIPKLLHKTGDFKVIADQCRY